MKKAQQQQAFEKLLSLQPGLSRDDVVSAASSNLDPDLPSVRTDGVVLLTKDTLRVFRDGKLCVEEPVSGIGSFAVTAGVGCCFAEYVRESDGEHILFARADERYRPSLSRFVKRANHYLRFHDTDFSASSGGEERVCPRCGKPLPSGMHTCPKCASKRKALLRLMGLAKHEWGYIFAAALLFFLTTAVSVLTPMINRELVDGYILNTTDDFFLAGFIGVVLAMLGAGILRRAIGVARSCILTIGGNNLIVRLRKMVFCKIQQLSIAKISRKTSGELMKNVNSDTNVIKGFIINHFPNLLEQTLLLVAIAAIIFTSEWKLALLILLPAPFAAFAMRVFRRFIRKMINRRWQLNSQSNAILHDIFSGIRVVKSYGMEKREEDRFISMAAQEREAQIRLERAWAVLMPILNFAMGIGEYVILFYVGRRMLNGTMTAGEMSQFSSYAGMIFGPLNVLMTFPRHFTQMMTSLTRVYEIVDETVDVPDGTRKDMGEIRGVIDVDHVSFGYDDAEEVLRDITLHAEPGEFIGLVGKSGVGKSTLINLIMRMYDVDEGAIRIDGVDIRDIPQEILRSRMGVVLQENFLFTGSIWQNLTYAKPDATPEEVIRASKAAGAHEFIIRLPDGYDTYVGERGHTLSGGERQRVSIARALLHNPKILILDEATASLDTETEKLIQDALQSLAAGRTTIAIAHRLSTLRNATRLVVMDKGGIAEMGTHEELMEKKGIYYGLVMAQREMTRMNP